MRNEKHFENKTKGGKEKKMKKVGLVVLAVLLVAAGFCGGWYLKERQRDQYLNGPTTVSVGPEIIALRDSNGYSISNGYVLFANKEGDIRHFGRCSITNLSFYWVETDGLYYAPGTGMLISIYAAQGLRQLIKEGKGDLAYKIAEEAFEKTYKEELARGKFGKYNKLIYPLVFTSDLFDIKQK